ncbi:hypothetical protein KQX62_11940 [Rhodopseudomonas palustris]|uniref:DUF6998 domain-containing protein n=1 Tax=Rhodopseudomonas palustris TaxID=1076 RepID=A0AAX3E4K0_RHOPL|nr:hypothetical protein [Rhodopseudomonas palustris]UYO41952.1 hypothetical protein KQX62_11940 [Rhodopseudomonas palustris]
MAQNRIESALDLIFQGIGILQAEFCNRKFTIDGRLVGDIGEIIAAAEFDITLDEISRPGYDAKTRDGRDVQIKATFQNSLTFRSVPTLYLGMKLARDGTHEIVFNGPGQLIYDRYAHRRGMGTSLLSFPVTVLRELSAGVPEDQRVPKRV